VARSTPTHAVDWDPLAPDSLTDPHGTYADLRGRCPVAWSDRWDGFWTLTRYADVVKVAGDPRTFISSVQNLVPKSPRTGLSRKPLSSDPPEHTVFRRVLNEHFAEERVARLDPAFRSVVARYLEPFLERSGGEAMEEVIRHLPVRGVGLWLDVPESEAEWIQSRSTRYVAALAENDRELADSLSAELDVYARALVARRKTEGRPAAADAVTGLLHTRIQGEPIPDEWVAGSVRMVIVAADRSTAAGAGFALEWLARDEELQDRLRRDPGQIRDAIEELLRLGSPSQLLVRTATRDTEIGGRSIGEGEAVAMQFKAANRDPEVFEDPDAFRLDRKFKRHLAFGHGIHKCAGAQLARLELRVVLEEFLARTRSFRLAGEVPHTRWPEYGPALLPLRTETTE